MAAGVKSSFLAKEARVKPAAARNVWRATPIGEGGSVIVNASPSEKDLNYIRLFNESKSIIKRFAAKIGTDRAPTPCSRIVLDPV
jgi:hypothetical protein